jgi:hypothetical protein
LTQEGIAFEALDNGVLSCENPTRLQELCDSLSRSLSDFLLATNRNVRFCSK